MVRLENNAITFFVNSLNACVPLQLHFLESGYYKVPDTRRYTHPAPTFSRLFLFRSGGGAVDLADETVSMGSRAIYLLPKNQPFRVSYLAGSDFYYFHFNLHDEFNHDVFGRATGIPTLRELPELFGEITEHYRDEHLHGPVLWQSAVFNAVMHFCEPMLERVAVQSHDSMKYRSVLRFVQENCSATLRVNDVAEHVGRSRSALSKSFRRDLSISLKQYLQQTLMLRARQLLIGSNLRVSEVAYALGYEDPAYFSRVFKGHMHESPSDYRDQVRVSRPA